MTNPLHDLCGDIDIYLFDQLVRGRLRPGMKVLDAGCGAGRNLVYLFRAGFDVTAVDADRAQVDRVRALAKQFAPQLHPDRVRLESVESLSFPAETFDYVISSAVLHFAPDEAAFTRMVDGMWRVLLPGGTVFARLASTIGIEDLIQPLGGRRFHLPDGTERFLVDAGLLEDCASRLGASFRDPLKTTVVHGQRSMTTMVLGKG